MRLPRRIPVLLLLAAISLPGALRGARAPLDERIFAGKGPAEPASFLVVLRDEADLSGAAAIADPTERIRFVADALRAQAQVSQSALRARLIEAGVPFRPFFLVNMIEVEAPRRLAEELAERPEVSSIAGNPRVALTPEPPPGDAGGRFSFGARAVTSIEPNVVKVGAPDVWDLGFTGQGTVVAVADTGFTWDHPALKSQYRGWNGTAVSHDYNWHDAIHDAAPGNSCGSDTAAPCDDDGHGTGTAGVSVGDDGAGNAIGVAPGARLIGCRNMDRGTGTPARYAECFEWFLSPTDGHGNNPRPDLAPHVINNSWGCPTSEGCTDPNVLKAVIDHVSASGIFVVFAAGNAGPACATVTDVPTFYASAFSVGATTSADSIAGFSSRGPATADGSGRLKPDLSAPGVAIRTAALPVGFQVFSGTSAAAPHVTGAVALLWSAVPRLARDVPGTIALLEQTAVPLTSVQDCAGFPGAAVPNAVFGWGRLDVAAAVAAAMASVPPVPRSAPVKARRTPPPRRVLTRQKSQ